MDRLSKALEKARADRASVVRAGATPEAEGALDEGAPADLRAFRDIMVRPADPAHLERHRVLPEGSGKNQPAVRAFKLLRTQVLQRMRSNAWQTLVVTSPTQGNGKTVTAINLAINLARQAQQKVLLADLDLRQPSIHRYLCSEPVSGISDFISGSCAMADILFNPGIEGLAVLPGRDSVPHSSEALLLPKTLGLIEEIRTRYGKNALIIFDMPPLLPADDVVAFSPHWDAALLVAEEGRTTDSELRRSMELLKGKPIVGTVLTKSQAIMPDYGY